jgi:hypothetical protein
MRTARCLTFVYFLLAVALASFGPTSLRAQDYTCEGTSFLRGKATSVPVRQLAVFSFLALHEAERW